MRPYVLAWAPAGPNPRRAPRELRVLEGLGECPGPRGTPRTSAGLRLGPGEGPGESLPRAQGATVPHYGPVTGKVYKMSRRTIRRNGFLYK